MGVIQRQATKQAVGYFIGTAIGAINNIFLYPAVFSLEELGFLKVTMELGIIFAPLIAFGGNGISVKFYPAMQDKKTGNHGFLSVILLLSLIGLAITFALLASGQDWVIAYKPENATLISSLYSYIFPIVAALSLNAILIQYSTNFLRPTVPVIINQSIKILLFVLCLAILFDRLEYRRFFLLFTIGTVGSTLLIILYYKYLDEWKITSFKGYYNASLRKSMLGYGVFGFLVTSGSLMIGRLDTLFVADYFDLAQAAIYSMAFFIASVISIPINSIIMIAAPIISRAWHEQDYVEMNEVYYKTSINSLIYGLLASVLILTNLKDLYLIIPNGERFITGIPVVGLLILGRLIEMGTSVNNEIIGYSSKYRMNLYMILLFGILNIGLYLFLIPKFGLTGAALAVATTILLFNVCKALYIFFNFELWPFRRQTLQIIVIGLLSYGLATLIPSWTHPILNILGRSLIVLIFYIFLTLKWQISDQFTNFISSYWQQFRGRI